MMLIREIWRRIPLRPETGKTFSEGTLKTTTVKLNTINRIPSKLSIQLVHIHQ